jgi:hypothetical protein
MNAFLFFLNKPIYPVHSRPFPRNKICHAGPGESLRSPQKFFAAPHLTRLQHPCRDHSQVARDVRRADKNVMSRDQTVAAAKQQANNVNMRCSCSGVDGHSRDRASGPASGQAEWKDLVCDLYQEVLVSGTH